MSTDNLLTDRKFRECYDLLISSKPTTSNELSQLFICSLELEEYDFSLWNFDLYLANKKSADLKKILDLTCRKISLSNTSKIIDKLYLKGDIKYCDLKVLDLFKEAYRVKNYGSLDFLIKHYNERFLFNLKFLIIKLNYYLILNHHDLERFIIELNEVIFHQWRMLRSSNLDLQQIQKLIIKTDSIDKVRSTFIYKNLQLLKYRLASRLDLKLSRESFLRAGVFISEISEEWKNDKKEQRKGFNQEITKEDVNILIDTSNYKANTDKKKYGEDLSDYKETPEENEILFRIKHEDEDIIKSGKNFVQVFRELRYYKAIIALEEKLGNQFSENTIFALWNMKEYVSLISYYEEQNRDDTNLENLYYYARAWNKLGNVRMAKKYLTQILEQDKGFRDVSELFKDV